MRPVRRGSSPQAADFEPYEQAKRFLVSRLGSYCSYCERRIATLLAVEHIQPKDLPAYSHLIGRWDNFLLGCVNCNSTKLKKDVRFAEVLLPDRDNTFAAFSYLPNGQIEPSQQAAAQGLATIAERTLALVGLDKAMLKTLDENDRQVALDRVSQRMEVWAVAEDAKQDIAANPHIRALQNRVISTALGYGFFSVWLTVFQDHPTMCQRLIEAFSGTRDSGCFDPVSAETISPAPNPDGLPGGGKI